MSKKSKSKGSTVKGATLSFSGKSKRKPIRDERGRFTTAERKTRELLAISAIKAENPGFSKADIRRELYSEKLYTQRYAETALEASYNFQSFVEDKPKITIIDTDGQVHTFRSDYEKAEALFNQELSALWRVATMLQGEREKQQKGKGKKKKSDTIIPEFVVEYAEYMTGVKQGIVFNFADNNLNEGLRTDMDQWDF